jgi:hypothetical protein
VSASMHAPISNGKAGWRPVLSKVFQMVRFADRRARCSGRHTAQGACHVHPPEAMAATTGALPAVQASMRALLPTSSMSVVGKPACSRAHTTCRWPWTKQARGSSVHAKTR